MSPLSELDSSSMGLLSRVFATTMDKVEALLLPILEALPLLIQSFELERFFLLLEIEVALNDISFL